MKKCLLLLLTVSCFFAARAQEYPYNNYNHIKRTLFRELPVTCDDIIFLGNSITDWCEWAEIFDNPKVKNRGIAADRAEWLFDRVDYLIAGHPAKLFVMIGINDLNSGREASEVAADIVKIIDMFRQGSPSTKIYIQSILPQNASLRKVAAGVAEKVVEVNKSLKAACEQREIVYVDVYSLLKDDNGQLNAEYTSDGLHLTGKGYLVWAGFIDRFVND